MGVSKANADVVTTRKCLPLLEIEHPNVSSQPVIVRIEMA
jgi:hypothetical protein